MLSRLKGIETVLVFQDATAWSVEPTGVDPAISAVTGSVTTAPSRQFFYTDFERTVNDVKVTGVANSTGLTVIFSNGGTLREIYLLKKEFAVLDVKGGKRLERPMRYTNYPTDPGRQAYRAEDATLISYSGLSIFGKSMFRLGWDYLPKVWVDAFRDLFYGPPIRKPFFFYPEPEERPNEVFWVYWESCLDRPGDRFREVDGFAAYPSAGSLASGYTFDANFLEI